MVVLLLEAYFIPLALGLLLPQAPIAAAISSPQLSFAPPPTPLSTSLVDLLSASPNHTLLLHAFQRARLIPTLNRLNGSTLFAPTNDAIKAEQDKEKEEALIRGGSAGGEGVWSWVVRGAMEDDGGLRSKEWLEGEDGEEKDPKKKPDNLQLALRDTLLYHLLNYTLIPSPSSDNSTNSTNPYASSISSSDDDPIPLNSVTYQETLYYPSLFPLNTSFPSPPSLPGSPPDKPDPDLPKGKEGLLRGQGQILRIVKRAKDGKTSKGKDDKWALDVGTDWAGEGGTRTGSERVTFAKNGALVELDQVIKKPLDLATQIRTNPRLSILSSLLPSQILDYISTASHLTLFAPTNEAWDVLSPLEMRYLRSGFAESDLTVIFGDASSKDGAGNGTVGYLTTLLNGTAAGEMANVSTILGSPLVVTKGGDKGGDYLVNGTKIETGDILASNGVLHTVPSLLLPSGALSLTAEKYLIALNATRFVSLLRSVNLSSYVQIPSGPQNVQSDSLGISQDGPARVSGDSYTILAPRDDIIAQWESQLASLYSYKGNKLPSPGSEELKKILEYHIIARKWTKEDLEDGMLLGTELRGDELRGARQMIGVSVHVAEEREQAGWDWVRSKSVGKGKTPPKNMGLVGFGGVNVLSDPIEIGKSIIYLPSAVLEPPPPIITSAVSDLRLSTFVASVYAASLDKALTTQPAVTYLIPENKAFASLGLVMSYLLLPTSRSELRSLVRYHAIDEIVYLDGFPAGGSKRYPTLGGSEIYVERSSSNASLTVHGPTSGGLPVNGETRDAKVVEGDLLTSTGVMHIIDQVELPPDLVVDLNKLLKGAKASTMVDLIRAANMSWILDGEVEPSRDVFSWEEENEAETEEIDTTGLGNGKKKKRKKKNKKKKKRKELQARTDVAYTILCPTDAAFARLNLTYYFANPPLLVELVKLHIIPTDAFAALSPDGKPLTLADEATYPSLLDKKEGGTSQYGSLAFRRWGEDSWLVGIKSARGTNGESDHARILAYGRATPSLVSDDDSISTTAGARLGSGGGVMTIDSVLLPYQPGWFRRYGWIVGLVVLGVALVGLVGLLVVKMWRGKQIEYEPLEGEED